MGSFSRRVQLEVWQVHTEIVMTGTHGQGGAGSVAATVVRIVQVNSSKCFVYTQLMMADMFYLECQLQLTINDFVEKDSGVVLKDVTYVVVQRSLAGRKTSYILPDVCCLDSWN